MTHNVIITDAGFAKDYWTSPISPGLATAQSIEVEAIDVPSYCEPDLIFMPPHLQIIRIDFPNFADGRGFTLARLIRLLGFVGRLRAKGHIIADQYAMARRSGFDEVEIFLNWPRDSQKNSGCFVQKSGRITIIKPDCGSIKTLTQAKILSSRRQKISDQQ